MKDPDYLLSAMMDELLPQMISMKEGNTESRYTDQLSIYSENVFGNQMMTYEEKVKLFNAKRYLMPPQPAGTKNWTTRDYIRFIDQVGRWFPEDKDKEIESYQKNK